MLWVEYCWRLRFPHRHQLADRTTEPNTSRITEFFPVIYPFAAICFWNHRASDDDNDNGPEKLLKDADTSSDSAAASVEATRPLSPTPASDSSEYVGPIPEPVSFNNRTAYGGGGSSGDHHGNRQYYPRAATSTWRRRRSDAGLRHCGGGSGGGGGFEDPGGPLRRSSTGGIGGRAALYGRHRGDSSESELTDVNDEVCWGGGMGMGMGVGVGVGVGVAKRRRRMQTRCRPPSVGSL